MDPEDENLTSHALVLYLRGICENLKFSLTYFTTRAVTSTQLFPIFWLVSLLEMACNLWLVAVASDGATLDRIFYPLNEELDGKRERDMLSNARPIYTFTFHLFLCRYSTSFKFVPFKVWTLHPIHVT